MATGVPTVLQQCFVFCRDNVTTEVLLSRQRRPRQEVRVAIRSLVKAKRFRVTTEICCVTIVFQEIMSRQGILCRDRVWPRLKGLVSQHNILCHDRVGQGQEFYVTTEYFCVAIEFSLGAGFLCRDKIFYVAT